MKEMRRQDKEAAATGSEPEYIRTGCVDVRPYWQKLQDKNSNDSSTSTTSNNSNQSNSNSGRSTNKSRKN